MYEDIYCTEQLSYLATLDELLFGGKLEAWRHKMFHIFHFLQCEMHGFGNCKSPLVNIYCNLQ